MTYHFNQPPRSDEFKHLKDDMLDSWNELLKIVRPDPKLKRNLETYLLEIKPLIGQLINCSDVERLTGILAEIKANLTPGFNTSETKAAVITFYNNVLELAKHIKSQDTIDPPEAISIKESLREELKTIQNALPRLTGNGEHVTNLRDFLNDCLEGVMNLIALDGETLIKIIEPEHLQAIRTDILSAKFSIDNAHDKDAGGEGNKLQRTVGNIGQSYTDGEWKKDIEAKLEKSAKPKY